MFSVQSQKRRERRVVLVRLILLKINLKTTLPWQLQESGKASRQFSNYEAQSSGVSAKLVQQNLCLYSLGLRKQFDQHHLPTEQKKMKNSFDVVLLTLQFISVQFVAEGSNKHEWYFVIWEPLLDCFNKLLG